MIFFFFLMMIFLLVGLILIGIGKIVKKQQMLEWGKCLTGMSVVPFFIILMCIL